MVTVFGATGRVGGKVAAMLLENGAPVRVLARSQQKVEPVHSEGAEVVIGSLNNVDDIKSALERSESAFLMTPIDWQKEDAVAEEISIGQNYAEALKDSTIRHIVYMSVISAREHTGIPHFESKAVIEDALESTGLDCTFLRPTFFMENFYQQWPLIQQMGVVSYPYPPDIPFPMVATEDIAYAAVQSLLQGGKGKQAFDMLGPKDYTMSEANEIISSIIEKPLRYVEATPEQAIESITQRGLPRSSAEDMVLMFEKYRTLEFKGDRNKVYDQFNFDATSLETVISTAAGALKAEAR